MILLRDVIEICKNQKDGINLENDQIEIVLRARVLFDISNREELDKVIKVAKEKNKKLSADEIEKALDEIDEIIAENRKDKKKCEQDEKFEQGEGLEK